MVELNAITIVNSNWFLSLKDIFGLSFSCCIFQKDLIFQLDCSCSTIQGEAINRNIKSHENFGIEIAITSISLEMKPLFVWQFDGQQFNSTIFNRKKLLEHEILGWWPQWFYLILSNSLATNLWWFVYISCNNY